MIQLTPFCNHKAVAGSKVVLFSFFICRKIRSSSSGSPPNLFRVAEGLSTRRNTFTYFSSPIVEGRVHALTLLSS